MAVTIDTTTATLGTGYAHQRSVDRASNGNLWCLAMATSTTAELHYSTDDGATWVATGIGFSDITSGSLHIAADDKMAVAYKADSTDYIYVTILTPNSTITSYSVVTNTFVHDNAYDRPSVVLFADPAVPGGYYAAVAAQYSAGADCRIVRYSGAGTPTLAGLLQLVSPGSSSTTRNTNIDFHHTGDGKTIQSGTPHIYTVVSEPGLSGVYFRKHVYSAGTWTPGSVVTLGSTGPTSGRCSMIFDGSRVCAFWANGSTLYYSERDAADTTTTDRTPTALADGNVLGVSITNDVAGDLWFAAIGDTSDDVSTSKLVRSTLTWGSWTATEAITATADSVQLRRCGVGQKIGVVYVQDTVTDAVRYHEAGTANTAPLAPTWVSTSGAADVAADLVLDWGFNDDQAVYGDTQSAYALKRTLSGSDNWWNGTNWSATSETYVTTATTTVTLSAGWAAASDADRAYYVRTKDSAGLAGPYGDALNVAPSAKVSPTITSAATEDTATRTTTWTVSEQSAFRVRLLLDGTTLLHDSGWRSEVSTRSYTATGLTLTNLTTVVEEVTTRNTEGLASNVITNEFDVTYTPPLIPSVIVESGTPTGAITVTIFNTDEFGSYPAVTYQDIYRREEGETGDGIRVATNIAEDGSFIDYTVEFGTEYEYMVWTYGANGTVSKSVWVGISTTSEVTSSFGYGAFAEATFGT